MPGSELFTAGPDPPGSMRFVPVPPAAPHRYDLSTGWGLRAHGGSVEAAAVAVVITEGELS
jgi:hypothetical protein